MRNLHGENLVTRVKNFFKKEFSVVNASLVPSSTSYVFVSDSFKIIDLFNLKVNPQKVQNRKTNLCHPLGVWFADKVLFGLSLARRLPSGLWLAENWFVGGATEKMVEGKSKPLIITLLASLVLLSVCLLLVSWLAF